MALKEAWCKLSGLEKEVGTDDPDHLKAARALSAPGSWLGSNYAEVGQCIRCFKRSRGGLSRYPIHPTHIDTSLSAQRQDETQQPKLNVGIVGTLFADLGDGSFTSKQHLDTSATIINSLVSDKTKQGCRNHGRRSICNWHEYWLWKVAAELSRESC